MPSLKSRINITKEFNSKGSRPLQVINRDMMLMNALLRYDLEVQSLWMIYRSLLNKILHHFITKNNKEKHPHQTDQGEVE